MSGLFDLTGRRVLITGASSGLGLHFAEFLADHGAHVICAARRLERLKALNERLSAKGNSSEALLMDVTNIKSIRAAFVYLEDSGGVDVVINNAGVTVSKPVLEQTESDWDNVIDTNLKGAWMVSTEAARGWVRTQRPGCIVNVASILGERVAGAVAPYAASKAGLLQLTKALALELARYDIRVNALAPGYMLTDLNHDFLSSDRGQRLCARIPQRRFGEPADLDGALLLLTADAGRRMTGAVLAVDGGHLVSSL